MTHLQPQFKLGQAFYQQLHANYEQEIDKFKKLTEGKMRMKIITLQFWAKFNHQASEVEKNLSNKFLSTLKQILQHTKNSPKEVKVAENWLSSFQTSNLVLQIKQLVKPSNMFKDAYKGDSLDSTEKSLFIQEKTKCSDQEATKLLKSQ